MQRFINRADLERVAAAIYAGPLARRALYGLIFCVVTMASGVTLALIWLGLALLVDAARAALTARLPASESDRVRFALDVVASATLATAPAMLWFSHAPASAPAAIALLGLLLADAAFNAKAGRLYTALACSPYASLGLAMALEQSSTFWGVAACGLAIAYVFGAAMHHATRAKVARQQDAEWVRQTNMRRGQTHSANWEIDYEHKALSGDEALSALLGRPVNFHAIAESACYATEADRALVRAVFAPGRRHPQRIAIEHDAVRQDGSSIRLRHEGFLHTAPDGAAQRLTCASTIAHVTGASASESAAAAFALQADSLRKISHELGSAPETLEPARDIAAILQAVSGQAVLVSDGATADPASLAKSQFLASMSHELRTPLNAVLGYAELLKEDAEERDDASTVQDLDRILVAAKQLRTLLNQAFGFSKIEDGRIEAAPAGIAQLR